MLASAIIPAAGSGKRFGEKKQFKEINGKPLIYYTLAPFFKSYSLRAPKESTTHIFCES